MLWALNTRISVMCNTDNAKTPRYIYIYICVYVDKHMLQAAAVFSCLWLRLCGKGDCERGNGKRETGRGGKVTGSWVHWQGFVWPALAFVLWPMRLPGNKFIEYLICIFANKWFMPARCVSWLKCVYICLPVPHLLPLLMESGFCFDLVANLVTALGKIQQWSQMDKI